MDCINSSCHLFCRRLREPTEEKLVSLQILGLQNLLLEGWRAEVRFSSKCADAATWTATQGPAVQQCWESVNVTSRSTLMSFPPQLLQSLDSLKERAKDAVWAVASCLCKQSASVKINGRTCQYRNIEHRHILTDWRRVSSQNSQSPRRGRLLVRLFSTGWK